MARHPIPISKAFVRKQKKLLKHIKIFAVWKKIVSLPKDWNLYKIVFNIINDEKTAMKIKESFHKRIFRFYYEGFRSMDLGRTLWLIILIKLFILFIVLKICFFPRYLNRFDTTAEKVNYITNELVDRALNP